MTLHLTDFPPSANVEAQFFGPSENQRAHAQTNGIYRNLPKRAIDVVLVLMSAPLVLPLVGLMALLISLTGRLPFYAQERIGRNSRVFYMWKLRTMVPDADKMLEKYLSENEAARLEWETTQKLKNDPRITKLGALLRRTSLDELPQLWNVLRGQMSIVGPRPMMVEQRSMYEGTGYFRVRPGITGLWQVSDRNECEFSERAVYDDVYDRTLSIGIDAWIMMKTVGVMMRGTGY